MPNPCYLSVMVAAKFFDDIYYDNAYYAKVRSPRCHRKHVLPLPFTVPERLQVGGIPTTEMNSLELEFLFMINFTLNVTPEVYKQYETELTMRTPTVARRLLSRFRSNLNACVAARCLIAAVQTTTQVALVQALGRAPAGSLSAVMAD
eukprot:SAG31_NODE_2230_length_6144_cov_3.629115_7_plen_148_part_00